MTKEFNLSDKKMVMEEYPYYAYSEEDVKEFIRLLKETYPTNTITDTIDKLAGDKLK